MTVARLFNLQKFSIHDGPGIRTTVFFKGCPLRCPWCSNPESQSFEIEEFWDKNKNEKSKEGYDIEVDDIVEEVLKDKDFYDESSGGVTLSGGEVLSQLDAAIELLEKCKSLGIHTAAETTCYISKEKFEKFIKNLDLLLCDIKHWNDEKSKEITGVSLKQIHENITHATKVDGLEVIARIPVIPGFNDSLEDAREFSKLLMKLNINKVELLPYHNFGENKYEMMGKEYKYKDIKPFRKEDPKFIEYKKIIDEGIKTYE